MTNAQIIFTAEQELAKEGIIKYTGRSFEMIDLEGNKIVVPETEAIHTFQHWKELGYSVKKGSKAVTQLLIWKCTKKLETLQDANGNEISEEHRKMFMKKASFFSASQVEALA